MQLELISFKTCPFVQRAAITLGHKEVAYKITYIDLAQPPDWFLEISPLGKVPVLKVDDEILFESAVINEFIDDVSGGQLQPEDPLARAKNRAWIEVASAMLGSDYMMKTAVDKNGYTKHRDALAAQMVQLENQFGNGPWFNGEEFSLVDTAFAPLFTHQAVMDSKFSVLDENTMPKLHQWSARLLALSSVKNSVVPDFESIYAADLKDYGSYISRI